MAAPNLPSRFTVRVYGFLLNELEQILISHENIDGQLLVKLPGGGLEFGEGPQECLVREYEEETGLNIAVKRLVHVTSQYIQSLFDDEEQVIGIYYIVEPRRHGEVPDLQEREQPFRNKKNLLRQEWVDLHKEGSEIFTFEADREAAKALLQQLKP